MTNPINANWRTEWPPIAMITASLLSGLYFYSRFPERVPSHWGVSGQVDGWSSPFTAAFLMPVMIAAIYLLLLFVPGLDPKRDRYQEFGRVYHIFKNTIIGFMVALYFLVGLNGIGYDLPIGALVPAMVGVMFILIGNYMSKLRLNWFIGARTPWTLSSENVWNKTNRLSGKLFVLGGLLMLAETVLPISWRMPVLIFIVLLVALIPFIYSYFAYSKEEREKNK